MDAPSNTYDYPSRWKQEAYDALEKLHPNYEFALFSSGAEAVEAAIRIAREIAEVPYHRDMVAGFTGCFHGKTYLTGLLTDNVESDLTTILRYGDTSLRLDSSIFTVIVEPFQCRNGVGLASPLFFERLVQECESAHVILIDDEISTSLRSGYALAIQKYVPNYEPGIICLGKNYGQGVPVSIVGVHTRYADKVHTSLTSGFGSNPLACIAISESLREITPNLDTIRKRGMELAIPFFGLAGCSHVTDVRSFGMWYGLELDTAESATWLAARLLEYGYIVGLVGKNIRLAPPFGLDSFVWKQFIERIVDLLSKRLF